MNAAEQAAADRFQLALGVSPRLAALLAARGWRDTAALTAFLYPRLEHTHSPWLMLGMEPAVARILQAVAAGEKLLILGDYDADGTLATVILRQTLRTLGVEAAYHLPQRLAEGYGLQSAVLERAVADGVTLAITVDTGIRELEPLARARQLGLDVIVTDHHLPGERLPLALAILNPHQPGCGYPDKGLCGSGVAFKLAQALLERGGQLGNRDAGAWPPRLRSYLKLVALATIADAAPLLGENRVLARFGLRELAEPVNPGLRALLALACPDHPGKSGVSSREVAFRVAPRLNAAGRMGSAERVVELFFAPAGEAAGRAQALEEANAERRRQCDRIMSAIEADWAQHPPPPTATVLRLAGEGWHRGVLGIVASRVLERYRRPALVASLETGSDGLVRAHGSGRAPNGIHLLQLLDGCRDLFDRLGGHAQAVGFALPAAAWEELGRRLDALPPPAPALAALDEPRFELSLADLTPAFARELARLEPWGEANPEPIFRVRGASLAAPPTVLKQRHAKFTVERDGARQTALFWNLWRDGVYQAAPGRPGWQDLTVGTQLDLEFRLELSSHAEYGERIQLILDEFAVTSGGLAQAQSNLAN